MYIYILPRRNVYIFFLGDRPLLIKIRPCTSLYQRAWQLFQLPGPPPPDPPPLTSIPPSHTPPSVVGNRSPTGIPADDAQRYESTSPPTPSPLLKSFIWMINYDRPFIVYIPIYLRIRSLGVKVVALMNVGLLLYIMHNWLVSHRYYLAVCFWSASFRIPPSLRLLIQSYAVLQRL